MKQLLLTGLILILTILSLSSQTVIEWNGDGDATSWDDPDNWDLDVVPNNTHRAEIFSGAIINISGTQAVDELYIDNATTTVQILVGATLNIDENPSSHFELRRGIFKNFGDLNIVRFATAFNIESFFTNESGGIITLVENGNNGNDDRFGISLQGTMTNYGTMNMESLSEDEDVIFNRGTFINEGELNISGDFKRGFANYNTGEFINESSGTINAGRTAPAGFNASTIWTFNEMENHGTINIVHPTDPDADMNGIGLFIDAFATFENTGTINISHMTNYAIWYNHDWDNTGTLNLGSTNDKMIGNSEGFPSELNNTSGEINGSGLMKCHEGLVGGTLNIGDSPGEVTFQVSQDMTNEYAPLEIAGTAGPADPNGHDVIYGDRQNSFFNLVDIELGDADLDIYLLGGFQPVYGDEFLIIQTDGELSGQYGIIGFPTLTDPNLFWEIDYDYSEDEVILKVNAFVIPVEMVAFNVVNRQGNHELEWTTASEINTSHFEIQMSKNNTEWQVIGNVNAQGNSSVLREYDFEYHPEEITSVYYYRLKIIDFDGSYEYSELRTIRQDNKEVLSAYPNPFTDQITIKSENGFSLFDSTGKMIYRTTESSVHLQLEEHPKGFYLIKYPNNNHFSQKLIKL